MYVAQIIIKRRVNEKVVNEQWSALKWRVISVIWPLLLPFPPFDSYCDSKCISTSPLSLSSFVVVSAEESHARSNTHRQTYAYGGRTTSIVGFASCHPTIVEFEYVIHENTISQRPHHIPKRVTHTHTRALIQTQTQL